MMRTEPSGLQVSQKHRLLPLSGSRHHQQNSQHPAKPREVEMVAGSRGLRPWALTQLLAVRGKDPSESAHTRH
jgi:hypothetical protein